MTQKQVWCLQTSEQEAFERGRLDALMGIKLLQAYGLWTKAERASWTKKAASEWLSLKHSTSYLPQVTSYYAGRVAALKSALTTHYPPPRPEMIGLTVFLPLMGPSLHFCRLSGCRHIAAWKCHLGGNPDRMILLCDCCRERLMRAEVACGASGDEYLLPLPVSQVFGRPASSGSWLLAFSDLADTPILVGWRDVEETEPVFMSVGEIASITVRQPVVWAMVYGLLCAVPPVGVSLLLPMAMLLFLCDRKEEHDEEISTDE